MKKFESIRCPLALSYAAIALLAAFSLGLVLHTVLRNYYDRQEVTYLRSRAIEISSIASQLFQAGLPQPVIQDLSRSWSFVLRARVRVLDAAGNQVADSGTPGAQRVFFIASQRPIQIPFGESVIRPMPGQGLQTLPANTDQFFQIQILRSEDPGEVQKDVILFNQEAVGVALPVDASMNGLLDSNAEQPSRRSVPVLERVGFANALYKERMAGADEVELVPLEIQLGVTFGADEPGIRTVFADAEPPHLFQAEEAIGIPLGEMVGIEPI